MPLLERLQNIRWRHAVIAAVVLAARGRRCSSVIAFAGGRSERSSNPAAAAGTPRWSGSPIDPRLDPAAGQPCPRAERRPGRRLGVRHRGAEASSTSCGRTTCRSPTPTRNILVDIGDRNVARGVPDLSADDAVITGQVATAFPQYTDQQRADVVRCLAEYVERRSPRPAVLFLRTRTTTTVDVPFHYFTRPCATPIVGLAVVRTREIWWRGAGYAPRDARPGRCRPSGVTCWVCAGWCRAAVSDRYMVRVSGNFLSATGVDRFRGRGQEAVRRDRGMLTSPRGRGGGVGGRRPVRVGGGPDEHESTEDVTASRSRPTPPSRRAGDRRAEPAEPTAAEAQSRRMWPVIPCRPKQCRTIQGRTVPTRTVPTRTVPTRTVPTRTVLPPTVRSRTVPTRTVRSRAIRCRTVRCRTVRCRTVRCRTVRCRTSKRPARTPPSPRPSTTPPTSAEPDLDVAASEVTPATSKAAARRRPYLRRGLLALAAAGFVALGVGAFAWVAPSPAAADQRFVETARSQGHDVAAGGQQSLVVSAARKICTAGSPTTRTRSAGRPRSPSTRSPRSARRLRGRHPRLHHARARRPTARRRKGHNARDARWLRRSAVYAPGRVVTRRSVPG